MTCICQGCARARTLQELEAVQGVKHNLSVKLHTMQAQLGEELAQAK